MKGYEAKDLEALFKSAGKIRRGDSRYANDDGYWTGGTCNWGANHNLREDCQTIASSFAKIDSLKEIRDTLTKCLSEQDFNAKKQNFIRKCDESASGLRPRTGYASSMFGICIIWADEAMSVHVEKCIEGCRKEVEKVKSSLERETYKWVEELRRIQLEIDEIKKRMEENKQKAMRENDPIKKQALLAEIESDGKLLQQKYQEHQEHSNKFRFDPSKYVGDMVEAMKKAIEGRNKSGGRSSSGGGGSSGSNRRSGGDPSDPFGDPNNWIDPDDNNILGRTPKSRNSNQPQNNQQLILIAIAIAVVFFLFTQKSSPKQYDYYDY